MKSGFAAIIGKPNVGKSTLMNALLGEKLSITTNKPQTTRKRVMGILSTDDYQIIFLDTPGILKAEYLLQEKMLGYVERSVQDADLLLFLIDAAADPDASKTLDDPNVDKILKFSRKKKIAVINKADLSDEEKVKHLVAKLESLGYFDRILSVSAMLNFNVDGLLSTLLDYMPEHPKFYPDDRLSDETERFFVSEIIREKIFEMYQEEIPYSCEVLIEDFKERDSSKDYVLASVIVEKETQKPIIIGRQGAMIKQLGQRARKDIESFLGRPVFLEIRVKVREKWRSDPKQLKSFGYLHGDEE